MNTKQLVYKVVWMCVVSLLVLRRGWVFFCRLRVRSLMTGTASDMNFAGFRFSVGLPHPDGRALILTAIISMQTTIMILATAGRKKMCISEHMFP